MHYPLVAAWWRARGNEALPADVLPPTGSVVIDWGCPIAASFCYISGKVAFIAFTVARPDLPPRLAIRASTRAITDAIDLARTAGCTLMWSTTEHPVIDRIYRRSTAFRRTTPHHNYFLIADDALSFDMLVGEGFEKG